MRELLAAAAVALVATNVLLPGVWAALFFNLCFWSVLVVLLHAQGVDWRDGRYLVPLPFLYYLTFAWQRELASRYDMVLGADTARYLAESTELTAGVRHLGYGVITWPRAAMSTLGGAIGLERLGTDYLYLQSAVIGGIAVVLLSRILRELGTDGWRRLGIVYAFGLSFSVWMLAGVVDPQIVSTMLLLLLLLSLLRYVRSSDPDGGWIEPCAISVLAATMSIENLYMPALFAVAWLLRRRPHRARHFLDPLLFAVALIAALGMLLLAAEMVAGPRLYAVDMERFGAPDGIVSHLRVFTSFYLEIGPGLAPAEIGRTAFQVFVMAVRAQPGVPVDRYRFSGELTADPANWLYVALMAALAAAAFAGSRARHGREREFAWVLVAGLLGRQLFVTVYDRWESVLFSLPFLAFLWLLLGMGIGGAPLGGRRRRWLAGLLALLLALLVLSNAAYVLDVPTR